MSVLCIEIDLVYKTPIAVVNLLGVIAAEIAVNGLPKEEKEITINGVDYCGIG